MISPGSKPVRGHHVVFLEKTLFSHRAFLRLMGTAANLMLGVGVGGW